METWFAKSIMAMVFIVPAFLSIPYFKVSQHIDPLVFLVWYFIGTAISIGIYCTVTSGVGSLFPSSKNLMIIIFVGLVFGALANGFLFQAVAIAPNPGMPPVIYATSSLLVFLASAFLSQFVTSFKNVTADPERIVGILVVLFGLFLLSGGLKELKIITA